MKTSNNFYILTGAPGTGKTTLLKELAKSYDTVDEFSREVIAQQRLIGGDGLWDKNRQKFINLLHEQSMSRYANSDNTKITFFDRGIPDTIAYGDYGNVNINLYLDSSRAFQYNKIVFLFPPWEEIYENDDERTLSYQESVDFHKHILRAYKNYDLVEVPKASISSRIEFINKTIKSES